MTRAAPSASPVNAAWPSSIMRASVSERSPCNTVIYRTPINHLARLKIYRTDHSEASEREVGQDDENECDRQEAAEDGIVRRAEHVGANEEADAGSEAKDRRPGERREHLQ